MFLGLATGLQGLGTQQRETALSRLRYQRNESSVRLSSRSPCPGDLTPRSRQSPTARHPDRFQFVRIILPAAGHLAVGSASPRTLKMTDPVFVCPHCGNKTPHKSVFSHKYVGDWYRSDGQLAEDPPTSFYTGYACATCGDLSIYSSHDYQEDMELNLVFPSDVSLDASIPDIVASNYRESKRVQKVSPNAFAVLIRRSLEALCDDRGIEKGTLHTRLKSLAAKGEIPPVLVEVTDVLRTLGNAGAHTTDQKVTVPLTWQMDKFFRTLVEYVYVAPARLKEFRKSLDSSIVE